MNTGTVYVPTQYTRSAVLQEGCPRLYAVGKVVPQYTAGKRVIYGAFQAIARYLKADMLLSCARPASICCLLQAFGVRKSQG